MRNSRAGLSVKSPLDHGALTVIRRLSEALAGQGFADEVEVLLLETVEVSAATFGEWFSRLVCGWKPLPDGRKLELSLDPVLAFVLSAPGGGGAFAASSARCDASATAHAPRVSSPPNGALRGPGAAVARWSRWTCRPPAGSRGQLRHVAHPLAISVE